MFSEYSYANVDKYKRAIVAAKKIEGEKYSEKQVLAEYLRLGGLAFAGKGELEKRLKKIKNAEGKLVFRLDARGKIPSMADENGKAFLEDLDAELSGARAKIAKAKKE